MVKRALEFLLSSGLPLRVDTNGSEIISTGRDKAPWSGETVHKGPYGDVWCSLKYRCAGTNFLTKKFLPTISLHSWHAGLLLIKAHSANGARSLRF